MRKLLALLLALLLPLCAAAETYGFSIQVDADEANFINAVQNALVNSGAEAAAAEKQAELMKQLLDDAGIEFKADEKAFYLALQLCGSQVFDLTAYEQDEMTLVTSSMLAGYALAEKAESQESTVLQSDWDAASQHVAATLLKWCAGIEKTESTGMFVGDAYEGGTKCTTWTFDDQMLSQLIDEILTEDVREVLRAVYEEMGLEAAEILANLDKVNKDAALNNRYAYVVRAVENEEKLVGLSLTVLQADEQAATISLGMKEDGIKAVVGLGLEKQNYWCEFSGEWMDAENGKSAIVTVCEWAASKDEAFAYVQVATAPANAIEWTFNTVPDASGYTWNSALHANGELLLSANGTAIPEEKTYNGTIIFGTDVKPLLNISFAVCPTEAIPEMDTSLVICTASDPADAELFEKLSNQLVAAISARLLKILPMDLILQMAQ